MKKRQYYESKKSQKKLRTGEEKRNTTIAEQDEQNYVSFGGKLSWT